MEEYLIHMIREILEEILATYPNINRTQHRVYIQPEIIKIFITIKITRHFRGFFDIFLKLSTSIDKLGSEIHVFTYFIGNCIFKIRFNTN